MQNTPDEASFVPPPLAQPPLKMIGSLLRSAASTFSHQGTPRSQPPLESVTEEAHTRDLLFPEVNVLRSSLHAELPLQPARPPTARDAANFDDRGALDLSYPADVRMIIAQDANSRYHQPQVLYDSRPFRGSEPRSGSPQNEHEPSGRQALLTRGKAMTSPQRRGHTPSSSLLSGQPVPLSPTSPRSPEARRTSFFGDARSRAPAFDFGAMDYETAQGKLAREAKEEMDALLACMFGAPGFRLEPSTKLHVVPRNAPDGAKSPGGGTRPISSGGFNRRRTPLVRSTSAADFSNGWSASSANGDPSETRPPGSRPAVMVTRLFSVNLPESSGSTAEDEPQASAPPPSSNLADSFAAQKGEQTKNVKQKKVPMYAIAVVLQLPPDGSHRYRTVPSQGGLSSLGSSLNDHTPANSWRAEQSTFSSFMEIRAQTSIDTVLNPYISQVIQHWNVLSRSIELLEIFAKSRLMTLLEQCTPPTPLAAPPRPGMANVKTKKPKPQSQQSVYVLADCFQDDWQIKRSTEAAAQTIVSGLRTRRVVVGQGRWGAWREEARWVARWASGREQNFFFFNFLTAFLGSHTAWLESLSPARYRRRHATQQRLQGKDNSRMRHRTVIISSDKMAARRLIFLLATFFPSNLNQAQPFIPNLSTSQQLANLQYGSPSVTAMQASTATQRGGSNRGHNRTVSFNETAVADSPNRRESDAQSIRSLAIPRRTADSRKASLSTVTADAAQAVPHFSNLAIGNPSSPSTEKRPGSGGSMASNALSQTLMRSESSNFGTSASGRWGSMMSGFWSSRRDSTDYSDVFPSSQDSPTRSRAPRGSAGALEAMVEEANAMPEPTGTSASPRARLPSRIEDCLIKPPHPAHVEGASQARSIPRRPKTERLPLKLSFNESEGYIDVSMPTMHSFSSSLASSFASIRLPHQVNPGSADHYSPYGSTTSDSPHPRAEPTVDIAGWLKTYHPDFTVQAIKPYDALLNEVKASMFAEAQLLTNATDPNSQSQYATWTDVCSTLIADTSKFTVERLRLRIRRRQSTSHAQPPESLPATSPTIPRSPPTDTADPFETELLTENIMDIDATLIDAVERVLAQSGSSSRAPSRAVSPYQSSSRRASPTRRASARPTGSPPSSRRGPSPRPASIHSTRTAGGASSRREAGEFLARNEGELHFAECRKVVLGALEEVVRSVVEEREEDEDRRESAGVGRRGKMVVGKGGGVRRVNHKKRRAMDDEEVGVSSSSRGGDEASGGGSNKGGFRGRNRRQVDSSLREGVRRWLDGVEEGW